MPCYVFHQNNSSVGIGACISYDYLTRSNFIGFLENNFEEWLLSYWPHSAKLFSFHLLSYAEFSVVTNQVEFAWLAAKLKKLLRFLNRTIQHAKSLYSRWAPKSRCFYVRIYPWDSIHQLRKFNAHWTMNLWSWWQLRDNPTNMTTHLNQCTQKVRYKTIPSLRFSIYKVTLSFGHFPKLAPTIS